jgi:hypothetical protein
MTSQSNRPASQSNLSQSNLGESGLTGLTWTNWGRTVLSQSSQSSQSSWVRLSRSWTDWRPDPHRPLHRLPGMGDGMTQLPAVPVRLGWDRAGPWYWLFDAYPYCGGRHRLQGVAGRSPVWGGLFEGGPGTGGVAGDPVGRTGHPSGGGCERHTPRKQRTPEPPSDTAYESGGFRDTAPLPRL